VKRILYAGALAILVAIALAGSAEAAAGAPDIGGTAGPVSGQYAPKGAPPPAGASAALDEPAGLDSAFLYGTAFQFAVANGAWGYFTVNKPALATDDFHSLGEIAAQSADGRQIVEIGWTVDRALNGDDDPHLFVFHWVDRVPTCYNGCGFVPLNEPGYTAGMKLPVSATPRQFAIRHHGTNWWVGYNRHWVGSFPDSLWDGRYKSTGLVQWFGEVSGKTATPCTQMGDGEFAASATAARIDNVGFWAGKPGVTPAISTTNTNPAFYTALRTDSAGMRFGGPGACRAVPDVRGQPPVIADRDITAAGFVVGNVGTRLDPFCEHLDSVVSETPAPGTQLAMGSPVDYEIGIPPRNGCPTPH
jgi:hypothetical protein